MRFVRSLPVVAAAAAALVFATLLNVAMPSSATINGQVGQNEAEIACGGAIANATAMLKLAPADPDGKLPQATKDYRDDLERCPSPRYRNVATSWATFAQAIVDRRTGAAFGPDLDAAIAHLTTCVSDFTGSIADHCQTGLGRARQAKLDWAAAAPGGSPGTTPSP